MFQKKSPVEQEWEKLHKKEQKFLQAREQKKDTVLNQKLAEKVPVKLRGTLDKAFAKAFGMIFESGTGVIEKTYKKEEMQKDFQINEYANDVRQTKKSLKVFGKKAESAGKVNSVVSGAAQGIPIIGAVGGICDAVYMKRITEYANLKYKKRFLVKQRR